MRELKTIFLFRNTRGVISAAALCRDNGISVDVKTVPRHISSECGMCLYVSSNDVDEVERVLMHGDIPFQRHAAHSPANSFDLLTTVEYGGCSAKLPAGLLAEALKGLKNITDDRLLVGIDTCDDAGVYKISDEQALIFTTDFFPPICPDPYEFGQIAAANALSDVYAMGGKPILALNLVMFPAEGIPLDVLYSILKGGQEKVREAGCITVGGHTVSDHPPKYGLAVVGIVHPDRLMTNAFAMPGDAVVLSKALGTGVIVAGHRLGEVSSDNYATTLNAMKELNAAASEVASGFGVRCATDITGFGLLGHALNIARASKCTIEIESASLPVLPGVAELLKRGCMPGAAFLNLQYVGMDAFFDPAVPYEIKMLAVDPQTSGGLLFSIADKSADAFITALREAGCSDAACIGRILPRSNSALRVC